VLGVIVVCLLVWLKHSGRAESAFVPVNLSQQLNGPLHTS